jgi:hypothetical protein
VFRAAKRRARGFAQFIFANGVADADVHNMRPIMRIGRSSKD